MKKLLLTLVGVLILCLPTQAQLFLGVKAGPNLSNLLVNGDQGVFAGDFYQYKLGFQAGIYGQARFTDEFYIQPEVLWMSKGSFVLTNAAVNERENFTLSYLSLPLMGIVMVSPELGIVFGPEVSYLLSSSIGDQDLKAILNFKDWDLSLNGGAMLFLSEVLLLDLRFSFGVFNIENFALSGGAGAFTTRNASLQLSLGYMLSQE